MEKKVLTSPSKEIHLWGLRLCFILVLYRKQNLSTVPAKKSVPAQYITTLSGVSERSNWANRTCLLYSVLFQKLRLLPGLFKLRHVLCLRALTGRCIFSLITIPPKYGFLKNRTCPIDQLMLNSRLLNKSISPYKSLQETPCNDDGYTLYWWYIRNRPYT